MSSIFKATLLLVFFFGINKIVALVRQGIIAQQFGFSAEIDAFNIANNLPDLVFSLFSGGALALAFIPVFAEYIQQYGKITSWRLFSKIANILFVATLFFALIFGIFAEPIVTSNFGIAPGFSDSQQALVVELMRINLIAMVIFSLSGLVTASLQAHKHFLLPALAPILYNFGFIVGALIFAPTDGLPIGAITLPAFGMGVYGLVYGTILGAVLHLLIQLPGIFKHHFSWTPQFDFKDEGVRKVLRLIAPRVATIFLIQVIFLFRDNLASHLPQGSVTALTYGYYIFQVPETLIGTAIATAILPTLSELVTKKNKEALVAVIKHSFQVLIATTVVVSLLIGILLPQLIEIVFDFEKQNAELLVAVSRAYLLGLLAHTVLEVIARVFYAKQNPIQPLQATAIRTGLYLILGSLFVRSTGVVGLAFFDSIAVAVEVVILGWFLYRMHPKVFVFPSTIIRVILGCVVSVGIVYAITTLLTASLLSVGFALIASMGVYLLFVRQEIKILIKL